MHRRHYLAAAGSALTIAVAGCSNSNGNDGDEDGTDGEPTGDQPPADRSTDESSTDDESTEIGQGENIQTLQTELEDRDVDVHNLFRDGPFIVLDYFTAAEDENDEALDEEIVAISRAFAEVVEGFDQDLDTMECLALVDEETYVDIFQIRAEWARQYAAGDLSDEEYTQNVVDTLEYR